MSLLDGIKEEFKESLSEFFDELLLDAKEFFIELGQQIKEGVSGMMGDLIDLILYMPTISDVPSVHAVWEIMRAISFSIIGGLFVWKGFEAVLSQGSIGKKVDFKDMVVRMIYGIILASLSLNIVDLMVYLNNALVGTVRANLPLVADFNLVPNTPFGQILYVVLLLVQVVLCVRISIQYFMLIGESWLSAVLSPIFYTLWINPGTSGYLGNWLRRMFTIIMTPFIWSLVLALYAGLITVLSVQGSIYSMGISIALLLNMLKVPSTLQQFMQSTDNPITLMKQATNSTTNRINKVKTLNSNIMKKVNGFKKK